MTHCTKCGVQILTATAERTGGLCMPCKNGGGAPEWARRNLWRKHGMEWDDNIPWHRSPWGNEIVGICRKIVNGEIGCIDGSRFMVEFAGYVLDAAHGEKWLHKDWEIFFRAVWAADSLQVQVEKNSTIENKFSEPIRNAALKLLVESGQYSHKFQ